MCENVKNYCRICLDVESEHVPIFGDASIHLHIKSCLSTTVSANDGLPTDICMSCVSQLSNFYSFKLNAMFSQEWLESCIQKNSKKAESKTQPIQPLPDSEYNSDSLLEFLNNTANIEEYLNNLGREDIPSIVNMLDRNNENSMDAVNKVAKSLKIPVNSPKKKEAQVPNKIKTCNINMEVDILDSDKEIVNEILMKETEPKKLSKKIVKNQINTGNIINFEKLHLKSAYTPQNIEKHPEKSQTEVRKEKSAIEVLQSPNACFACKSLLENKQKLSQHVLTCDFAQRTCTQCNILFDSKQQMLRHSLTHNTGSQKCNCGKEFSTKENLVYHHKTCQYDCTEMLGFIYRCKQCKQNFKDRSLLYKHVKEHILKADERICDTCGHGFLGDEELKKHRSEVHGKADSNGLLYRCKVCSHTSPSHKELYTHVQKHLAVESDRHLCDTCGKTFKTSAILHRHSLLHDGVDTMKRNEQTEKNTLDIGAQNQCLNGTKVKLFNGVKRPYSEVQTDDKSTESDDKKCNICDKFFDDPKQKDCHVLQHIEMTVCDKCGECMTKYKIYKHFCA